MRTFSDKIRAPILLAFIAVFWGAGSSFASELPFRFEWRKAGEMPLACSNAAIVSFKGRIYIMGGNDEKGSVPSVWEFDPLRRTFSSLPDMPTPRSAHAAAVFDEKIFVFGGMQMEGRKTSIVSSVEALDLKARRWEKVMEMPCGRARFGLAATSGKIFITGGVDETNSSTARVDVFNPASGWWDRKRDLPVPRNRHCAMAIGGKLFVLGGEDGKGNALRSVLEYLPGEDRWVEVAPMKVPRKNFAAVRLGSKMIAAGGWNQEGGGTIFPLNAEVYDPVRNAWEDAGLLNSARDGVRAAAVNGKVYIFGGYGGKVLSTIEEGRWVSGESRWTMDEDLRLHIAWFLEDESILDDSNSKVCKSLGFAPDYEPDITNIGLQAITAMGFPLPMRKNAGDLKFYLKFYEYPPSLNQETSARRILEPLLVLQTHKGALLEEYLKRAGHVVVKKGEIESARRLFAPSTPYRALRVPVRPLSLSGEILNPQDFFDRCTPFSSLYVKPIPPTRDAPSGAEAAGQTAQGVLAFRREILEIYRRTFIEVKGIQSDRMEYFLDDSGFDLNLGPKWELIVIRVPRSPMVFENFRDLPMPQDPKRIFLTGLLLLYEDIYSLDKAPISWPLKDISSLQDDKVKRVFSHVFEVGSCIRVDR